MDTNKIRELLAKLRAEKQPDSQTITALAEATETLLGEHEQMTAALHRGFDPKFHPARTAQTTIDRQPDRTLAQRISDIHPLR